MPTHFGELINKLSKNTKHKFFIFGAPTDIQTTSEVIKNTDVKVIDLTGKTTIKELPAIINKMHLFITNDSGPMHIAVGTDVAVVAIFGATTKSLGFFPYSIFTDPAKATVVEKEMDCRPCGLHGPRVCPEGHFNCMKQISVDEVYNACIKLLP